MNKINTILPATLLGLSLLSPCFANASFDVTYQDYREYTPNACPENIKTAVNSNSHLVFEFEQVSDQVVKLVGSKTAGVTVTSSVPLNLNEEEDSDDKAYRSTCSTTLQTRDKTETPLHQLWVEKNSNTDNIWHSSFYLGSSSGCFLMSYPNDEMNFLSQPQDSGKTPCVNSQPPSSH